MYEAGNNEDMRGRGRLGMSMSDVNNECHVSEAKEHVTTWGGGGGLGLWIHS